MKRSPSGHPYPIVCTNEGGENEERGSGGRENGMSLLAIHNEALNRQKQTN